MAENENTGKLFPSVGPVDFSRESTVTHQLPFVCFYFWPLILSFLIEIRFFHTIYSDHGSPSLISSLILSTSTPTQHYLFSLSISLENKQANNNNSKSRQTRIEHSKQTLEKTKKKKAYEGYSHTGTNMHIENP